MKSRYLFKNIFILYFTPKTNTKSKKGHNFAKILQMITNIELDLYFRTDSVTSFEFKSVRIQSSITFNSTNLIFLLREKVNEEIGYNCNRGRDWINLLSMIPIRQEGHDGPVTLTWAT